MQIDRDRALDVACDALHRLARVDGQAYEILERFCEVERDDVLLEATARLLLERADLTPAEVAACRALTRERRQLVDIPPLYDYQAEGAAFLVDRAGALLADDPGLGKSLAALAAAEAVMGSADRGLVLCPASLTANWRAEIDKWFRGTSVKTFRRGGPRDLDPEARWHVISYDTAKQPGPIRKAITQRHWSVLILDEAHRLKNLLSKRYRCTSLLEADRIWLLTGTPIRNRPTDLFALLRLGRHRLGAHWGPYVARFGEPHQAAALARETADFVLRRSKSQVLDLPAKLRVSLQVEVPSEVAAIPADLGGLMRARHLLAQAKASATIDRVHDLLEDDSVKVLVFSGYKAVLDDVETAFRAERVDGSVTSAQRLATCQRFNEDSAVRVLVAQIDAAGEGLNLPAANHVIFNDLAFVPAQHWQAEDRAHRVGQRSQVTAHYLVADAEVDRIVGAILAEKLAIIDRYDGAIVPPEAGAINPLDLLERLREKKSLEAT